MTDTTPLGLIVVRLKVPVKNYPVGTELGYKDVADAIAALGSAYFFEVVRDQQGNPIPPLTPEEIEAAQRAAQRRAKSRRLILGSDFDPLWNRVEGIPSAEELTDMQAAVDAVADVPPRVEAVETALTGKADMAAVQAVEAAISAFTTDTAHPTLQAALNAGAGGTVIVSRSQTVPAGTVIPPKTRVLVGPGVVLKRQQPSTGDWITVGADAVLDGGEYDGNKGAATNFNTAYRAILVNAGGVIQNAYVHDNNGHGIMLRSNARAIKVRSDNHGNNPGPSGTGDGIYVPNSTGVLIDGCSTDNNARLGVVVTSTSADASATIRNTHGGDANGYGSFDFELYTGGTRVDVRASGLTGRGIVATGATLVLEDSDLTRITSGTHQVNDTDITLRRVRLVYSGGIVCEIYARRIVLEDVEATASTDSSWALGFYTAGEGYAHNVLLRGTFHQGIFFSTYGDYGSWQRITNARVDSAATSTFPARALAVRTVSGGPSRFGTIPARFFVVEGRWRGLASEPPPASGWTNGYEAGDVVENTAPSAGGSAGWVCVTPGTPGTWKSYGSIAT